MGQREMGVHQRGHRQLAAGDESLVPRGVAIFWHRAGAHHLANAAIHAANAALLFLLLRRLTNSTWRSAAAAAVFAWHPLRVESVAWIAERKDVLCAFFFLLSLLCWAQRVTCDEWQVTGGRGFPSPVTRHTSLFYWLALLFFALALMSKPMAVTLPFVLLLLDVWPLGRVAGCRLQVAGVGEQRAQPSTCNREMAVLRADGGVLRGDLLDSTRLRGHDAVGKTRPRPARGQRHLRLSHLSGTAFLAAASRGDLSLSERL